MEKLTSRQIRQKFLDFFQSQGHEILPSSPMVVKGDPTLMFINSGMAPFKNWFLGNEAIKFKRVADTQKCLRVSGKHNDLEEVGVDTYHHTMFEMLGNWSFGDYFKQEAIEWAWQLLTEVYGLSKDRLYVTVFEGDDKENLEFDQEAYDIWKDRIDEKRILRGNKKDNFWEMGDTGPCGPCSEIHIDLRSEEERAEVDGATLVNHDHPQVVEIWNNVFMQFERRADGSLIPLKSKHVDTGMGFERLCMALQGVRSNYDTDVFTPYIRKVEEISGKKYHGSSSKSDVAMRVIADHIRAVSFAIADGQLPSSGGAGYVIRRILRRAIRYGYSFLDLRDPFLHRIVRVLTAEMGDFFPELAKSESLITKVIKEEEESFLRTLEKGIQLLELLIAKNNDGILGGEQVFELYDTFGFPADLTALIASEHGKRIDQIEFDKQLQKQKERSRAATKIETEDWVVLNDGETEFVGYDQLECESTILRYRKVKSKSGEHYQLVLNRTPFYAESGGQLGDTGSISEPNDRVNIIDTKKENNLIVHFCDRLPENPTTVFTTKVDEKRRADISANHTSTHLLHEALRSVLGTHVEQKGSLVHPDYLRFDFSHFSKMSDAEIAAVSELVNEKVRANLQLDEKRGITMQAAKEAGAMMLFGEKYGASVRMITFGSSVELCGGTHARTTGDIGQFILRSEGAVAAGVRRIEAISATAADQFIKAELMQLNDIRELLKTKDAVKSLSDILSKNIRLEKEIEDLIRDKAQRIKQEVKSSAQKINGVNFISIMVDLPPSAIKDVSFQLRNELENLFAVFGSENTGKPNLTCVISDSLVAAKNMNASTIIRNLASEIKGGGGGQAFFATAGGTEMQGLERALSLAKNMIPAE
jgi:alanyl-tRNA synthetase